jgi:multiple sugar transport system substrate-binding protein
MSQAASFWGRRRILVIAAVSIASFLSSSAVVAAPILFLSTQLTPLAEATMMREVILKDFPLTVDFEPYDRAVFTRRVLDSSTRTAETVVVGGLREDFLNLYRAGGLESVNAVRVKLTDRTFEPKLSERSVFDLEGASFIPWMQATYLMAANKRALRYLPSGADVNRLSYDDLLAWASNMYRATGKARLGFPVGPIGLMPRFLQGYLYPSFTGSMMGDFAGVAARDMWDYMRRLWPYVTNSSLILNRTDQALLTGDAWVVWDHTARLIEAFRKQPDDFVAFPAPVGPKGRGFISVLAGLGVPKGSSPEGAFALIDYLTRPHVQVLTMESVGFLPVVLTDKETRISKGLSALVQASAKQLASPDGIFSSVPLLSGDAGSSFNLVFSVAFSQIVLQGFDIQKILDSQNRKLLALPIGGNAAAREITAR